MPLPGAADDAAGWSRGSAARDGQQQAEDAQDSGFDEALAGDPFASASGGLQGKPSSITTVFLLHFFGAGLHGRSESEFETIDWTFYQERDRQCVTPPRARCVPGRCFGFEC